jgi:hypothetical protein
LQRCEGNFFCRRHRERWPKSRSRFLCAAPDGDEYLDQANEDLRHPDGELGIIEYSDHFAFPWSATGRDGDCSALVASENRARDNL